MNLDLYLKLSGGGHLIVLELNISVLIGLSSILDKNKFGNSTHIFPQIGF